MWIAVRMLLSFDYFAFRNALFAMFSLPPAKYYRTTIIFLYFQMIFKERFPPTYVQAPYRTVYNVYSELFRYLIF